MTLWDYHRKIRHFLEKKLHFWLVPKKLMVSTMDIEKAKINLETAKISWSELQRFFAAGKVLNVAPDQDLTEVARLMSLDQVAQIAQLVDTGKIETVADERALEWYENNAHLWSVVVKPYVLVQEVVA